MLYVTGQVRNERASDYVLRPLMENEALRAAPDGDAAFDLMEKGGLYTFAVQKRATADEVIFDLVNGWVALFFPGKEEVLTLMTATEEKRGVTPPQNEPDVKGARDSFVESVRTNTSLVRRRLRTAELRVKEQLVGRQSVTPVDILYINGIADPKLAEEVERRLRAIDIDALLMPGDVEQYLSDGRGTAFPLLPYTERPDRFCAALAEGRVGILADGIPMGWTVPGTADQFLRAGQDESAGWLAASLLSLLRCICVLITLFLPGLYVGVVLFHPEMIPAKLALSIVAARENVPFPTLLEVLAMLLAFEVLQEAGLRLPSAVGQTVSILGGLVVGSAAVEAKLVSPAVLVVVAVAGICGYTVPSQDFAGALRLWRFLITVAGGVFGVVGVVLAGAALAYHLAGLESFGAAYLEPYVSGEGRRVICPPPLPRVKLRERWLNVQNRRKQR